MKAVKNQYHISDKGELFLSIQSHPYSVKTKKELENIISTYLKGTKYKIRKTHNGKTFNISRDGIPFIEIVLATSDVEDNAKYRKLKIPFGDKICLTNFKKNTPKELLIISPYCSLINQENSKLIPDKNVFLIMNKTDISRINMEKNSFNTTLKNITPVDFSASYQWFDLDTIKESIVTNKIIQNRAKNLSCVPSNKLVSFLNTYWIAYNTKCSKNQNETDSDSTKKGYAIAPTTGLLNERKFFTLFSNDSDFLQIANTQYCVPNDKIIEVSHTGRDKTMSIYNQLITQKADFKFLTQYGNKINVSLKKKLYAYLHEPTIERFFASMENIFGITPSTTVKQMIYLFFVAPDEPYYNNIINRYATHPYEIEKHRLFEENLRQYDNEKVEEMLNWFSEYQNEIFEFMAIRGNMLDPDEFITHIAFVDTETFNENDKNYLNKVIPIDFLSSELEQANIPVTFNPSGTQLKFAWGSIENHKNLLHTKINGLWLEKSLNVSFLNNEYNGYSNVLI